MEKKRRRGHDINKDPVRDVARGGDGRIPRYEVFERFSRRSRRCFIVVVWNEGERIRRQLERMAKWADLVDIIVADGASDDGSLDLGLLEQCRVRAHLSTRERGLATALRMAFSFALAEGYDGVVTVDGNGKDSVDDLPAFLEHLDAGYDLVQGSRFMPGGLHRNTPKDRVFAIRYVVIPLVRLASGFRYTDPTNGFRAMSERLLRSPEVSPLRGVFVKFNLQLYLTCRCPRRLMRTIEVPVSRVYPADGSVPTKITGLQTKLWFLLELFLAVVGWYSPKVKPVRQQAVTEEQDGRHLPD